MGKRFAIQIVDPCVRVMRNSYNRNARIYNGELVRTRPYHTVPIAARRVKFVSQAARGFTGIFLASKLVGHATLF